MLENNINITLKRDNEPQSTEELDRLQDETESLLYDKNLIGQDLGFPMPSNVMTFADYSKLTDDYIDSVYLYTVSYIYNNVSNICYIMSTSEEGCLKEFMDYFHSSYNKTIDNIEYEITFNPIDINKWRSFMKSFRQDVLSQLDFVNPYTEEGKDKADKAMMGYISYIDIEKEEREEHYRIYGKYPVRPH